MVAIGYRTCDERRADYCDETARAVADASYLAASPAFVQVTIDARDDRHDDGDRPFAIRHFTRNPDGTIADTGWRGWSRGSQVCNPVRAVADADLAAFLAH